MKILILTEGGRKRGFGHLARCMAICQSFEERGALPEFVVNGDETVGHLLAGKKHRIFNWVDRAQDALKLARCADIAIIDSYLAGPDFYRKISEITKIPAYIDDNNRIDYPRGVLINWAIYADEIVNPKKKDIAYLLGVKYAPLRREFREVPPKRINKTIKTVMVTFGGSDDKDLLPGISKLLIDRYRGFRKNVVIGKACRNVDRIEKLKDSKTRLVYSPGPGEMKELMLSSDLAISSGGQTLYELARIGVPAIAVKDGDNQSNNIMGLLRSGIISYAGEWYDKRLPDSLVMEIERLKDGSIRLKRSLKARRLVDGQGGRRVARALLAALNRGLK